MTMPDIGLALAIMAVLGIVYPHILYPLILSLVHRVAKRPVTRAPYVGDVTVIVAAYNEVDVIEMCLRSIKQATNAPESVRIIVADDGSTDGTADAVLRMTDALRPVRVDVIRCQRGGKNAALRSAIRTASTEIVAFTDADCRLMPQAIGALLAPFSDPSTGAVLGCNDRTGSDFLGNVAVENEALYRSVEDRVNVMEGEIASTVASNGALYAVRRSLLSDLPDGRVADDWWNVLCTALSGQRIVVAMNARVIEYRTNTMSVEVRRTIRTASAGMACLWHVRSLLAPTNGWISWFLWSHRIMRWSGPVFFGVLLAATIMSVDRTVQFAALFYGQFALYAMALLGYAGERMGVHIPIAGFVHYVIAMNAAFVFAFWNTLRGTALDVWSPVDNGSKA